eukprot:CAMPEP_0170445198 /NCGR_PEP_ID=MMETSP0117_2-20130122/48937_1 /TAXON_ID=400756 /ORGANISM="Durinskia baltica, Strain CSIRO CS-38" /LENGTH=56 /DNA_ID=CAMNT_0010706065 /DNA_START=56 /DNA_END=222 /DNA_ORIENTATION=+
MAARLRCTVLALVPRQPEHAAPRSNSGLGPLASPLRRCDAARRVAICTAMHRLDMT